MKTLAQIPRRICGIRVPFFYKTIEIELSDDGIAETNPILQKGEEVPFTYTYRGSHDRKTKTNTKK